MATISGETLEKLAAELERSTLRLRDEMGLLIQPPRLSRDQFRHAALLAVSACAGFMVRGDDEVALAGFPAFRPRSEHGGS